MKFGVALNLPSDPARQDAAVIHEHLALAQLAEPLGFDSLFVLEHHFTDYVLSPDPLQLLTFLAAKTTHIELGTAVAVLPLHNPLRLAEQIAMLDVIAKGRCVFAFGRGSAESEFRAFGVSVHETRQRFDECARIVAGALSHENFQFSGHYYQIPAVTLRPTPISAPHLRFFGAARSPESIKLIASLGFGLLVSTHKDWPSLSGDIEIYHAAAGVARSPSRSPMVLTMVSVDDSAEVARSRAKKFLARDIELSKRHYTGRTQRMSVDDQAVSDTIKNQVVGSPSECIEQIHGLLYLTNPGHLIFEFSYGTMPHDEAIRNMSIFSQQVLPYLRSNSVCPRDDQLAARLGGTLC